jgi:UDP-N-acetylglucosamine 2-epimerase
MKKIITVLGTRPEIIKLSPLLPLLDKEFEHVLVHTGQHYDYEMDKIFFDELDLKQPKYNIGVGSGSHGKQTGKMLEELEKIFLEEKPYFVIVLGDTNSTLAAALAASKLHIKVIHVESGCRSFNIEMPEEVNRVIVDHISNYLFVPDQKSYTNLVKEGIEEKKMSLVGDIVSDACLRNRELIHKSKLMERLDLKEEGFVLATVHRAENTSRIEVLKEIISALNELSKRIKIIFPIHPRTKKIIEDNSIRLEENVKVVKPWGYLDFLNLLSTCRFVMTDSGGIQGEAVVFNKPCLVIRNETEWSRWIDAGKNFLVGTKKDGILEKALELTENNEELERIKNIKYDLDARVVDKIMEKIRGL